MATTWEQHEHGVPAFRKKVLIGTMTADGDLELDEETENEDALEIIPATDANLNLNTELLDDTDLTVDDARTNIAGLREWSVDLTLNYKPDNTAYSSIRDAFIDRDNLWVVYIPNHPADSELEGTDEGYIGRVAVENFDHSGGVGDLETVDATLQSSSSIYWTKIEDIPNDSA